MDYGDYYCGLSRDYYQDPFPHSLLGTREFLVTISFKGNVFPMILHLQNTSYMSYIAYTPSIPLSKP